MDLHMVWLNIYMKQLYEAEWDDAEEIVTAIHDLAVFMKDKDLAQNAYHELRGPLNIIKYLAHPDIEVVKKSIFFLHRLTINNVEIVKLLTCKETFLACAKILNGNSVECQYGTLYLLRNIIRDNPEAQQLHRDCLCWKALITLFQDGFKNSPGPTATKDGISFERYLKSLCSCLCANLKNNIVNQNEFSVFIGMILDIVKSWCNMTERETSDLITVVSEWIRFLLPVLKTVLNNNDYTKGIFADHAGMETIMSAISSLNREPQFYQHLGLLVEVISTAAENSVANIEAAITCDAIKSMVYLIGRVINNQCHLPVLKCIITLANGRDDILSQFVRYDGPVSLAIAMTRNYYCTHFIDMAQKLLSQCYRIAPESQEACSKYLDEHPNMNLDLPNCDLDPNVNCHQNSFDISQNLNNMFNANAPATPEHCLDAHTNCDLQLNRLDIKRDKFIESKDAQNNGTRNLGQSGVRTSDIISPPHNNPAVNKRLKVKSAKLEVRKKFTDWCKNEKLVSSTPLNMSEPLMCEDLTEISYPSISSLELNRNDTSVEEPIGPSRPKRSTPNKRVHTAISITTSNNSSKRVQSNKHDSVDSIDLFKSDTFLSHKRHRKPLATIDKTTNFDKSRQELNAPSVLNVNIDANDVSLSSSDANVSVPFEHDTKHKTPSKVNLHRSHTVNAMKTKKPQSSNSKIPTKVNSDKKMDQRMVVQHRHVETVFPRDQDKNISGDSKFIKESVIQGMTEIKELIVKRAGNVSDVRLQQSRIENKLNAVLRELNTLKKHVGMSESGNRNNVQSTNVEIVNSQTMRTQTKSYCPSSRTVFNTVVESKITSSQNVNEILSPAQLFNDSGDCVITGVIEKGDADFHALAEEQERFRLFENNEHVPLTQLGKEWNEQTIFNNNLAVTKLGTKTLKEIKVLPKECITILDDADEEKILCSDNKFFSKFIKMQDNKYIYVLNDKKNKKSCIRNAGTVKKLKIQEQVTTEPLKPAHLSGGTRTNFVCSQVPIDLRVPAEDMQFTDLMAHGEQLASKMTESIDQLQADKFLQHKASTNLRSPIEKPITLSQKFRPIVTDYSLGSDRVNDIGNFVGFDFNNNNSPIKTISKHKATNTDFDLEISKKLLRSSGSSLPNMEDGNFQKFPQKSVLRNSNQTVIRNISKASSKTAELKNHNDLITKYIEEKPVQSGLPNITDDFAYLITSDKHGIEKKTTSSNKICTTNLVSKQGYKINKTKKNKNNLVSVSLPLFEKKHTVTVSKRKSHETDTILSNNSVQISESFSGKILDSVLPEMPLNTSLKSSDIVSQEINGVFSKSDCDKFLEYRCQSYNESLSSVSLSTSLDSNQIVQSGDATSANITDDLSDENINENSSSESLHDHEKIGAKENELHYDKLPNTDVGIVHQIIANSTPAMIKPFNFEEVRYLKEGFHKYGVNFKKILQEYPFDTTRTSMELYNKWKHDMISYNKKQMLRRSERNKMIKKSK